MSARTDRLNDWFDKIWIEQDLEAINDFFVPDTKANGVMPDMALTPQDYSDLVPLITSLLDDRKITIQVATETGDWYQALYRVEAVAAHNSAPIVVSGQVCLKFDGEKMVEAYNNFDFWAMFEQLGQLPEQSLALCLTGHRFE
jgi:hypothetical protein